MTKGHILRADLFVIRSALSGQDVTLLYVYNSSSDRGSDDQSSLLEKHQC